MTRFPSCAVLAGLVAMILIRGAVPARAQRDPRLQQLLLHVNLGDQLILVVDDEGLVRGRLVDVTDAGLILKTERRQRYPVPIAGIQQVSQGTGDSVENGAKIGLAVGAAVGLVGGFTGWRHTGRSPVAYALLFGGFFGGVGVGVAAAVHPTAVVYRADAPGKARGPGAAAFPGLVLAWRW